MSAAGSVQSSTNLFRRLAWNSSVPIEVRLADDVAGGAVDKYYVSGDVGLGQVVVVMAMASPPPPLPSHLAPLGPSDTHDRRPKHRDTRTSRSFSRVCGNSSST